MGRVELEINDHQKLEGSFARCDAKGCDEKACFFYEVKQVSLPHGSYIFVCERHNTPEVAYEIYEGE